MDIKTLLKTAAIEGDCAALERLVPLYEHNAEINPKTPNLLTLAATHGHAQCVSFLLTTPFGQHRIATHFAILGAAEHGHLRCVELLLPSAYTYEIVRGLCTAAYNGHTSCVEFLIAYCDPKAESSYALALAAMKNHRACMDLLHPVSDLFEVVTRLQEESPEIVANFEQWLAEKQRCRLAQHVDSTQAANTPIRKI